MANKITTILDLDGSRFGRGLKQAIEQVKAADGAVAKLKAGWAGVVAAFAASPTAIGAAAAGVGLAANKMISDSSQLEESVNAVNVAYGNAAEGVHALGEESADSFGLSQRAFNEAAVALSAFIAQISNASGQGQAGILADLQGRITDFASVMNLDVPEAARVFQSALAGETEPIRKFGIDLSAARVEQFAFANGLIKTKAELTETIKVQARYGLLMESTAKTANDFANTQDSLANQQKVLRANIEDLSAAFGNTLTPVVADAFRIINDLIGIYDELSGRAADAGDGGPFTGIVEGITKPWKVAGREIDEFANNLHILEEALEGSAGGTGLLQSVTDRLTAAVVRATGVLEAQRPAREAAQRQQDEYVDSLIESGKAAERAAIAAEKKAKADEEAAEAAAEHRQEVDRLVDVVGDYERSQLDTADAADALEKALDEQNELLTEGTVSAAERARSLDEVADANREVDEATAELNQALEDHDRLLRDSIASDREKADAQRKVEDAIRGVTEAQLSQRDAFVDINQARLDLEEAQAKLAELQAEGPGEDESVEDHTRDVRDAVLDVERARLKLERAILRENEANAEAEQATIDLTDAQEEQRRLLEDGTVTDEEKQRSLDRVRQAQDNLRLAHENAGAAVLAHQQLLRDSIPTDAEKEAATRDVERAELDLAQALADQATAYANEKGAIDGSVASLALQRQELERLRDETYPGVRQQIQEMIDLLNTIPGVDSSFSQLPVGVREGGGGTVQLTVNFNGLVTDKAAAGREVVDALDAFLRAGGAPPAGLSRIFRS